jgi:hypothetical protein
MENNKELVDALKNTIQIQNDLINHLKQEVERLKASQIITNNPPYQPLQPYTNPHQPGQPNPVGPWWGTMWVTTSDQANVNVAPNTGITSYNANQVSPAVSSTIEAGATSEASPEAMALVQEVSNLLQAGIPPKQDKFVPFAVI